MKALDGQTYRIHRCVRTSPVRVFCDVTIENVDDGGAIYDCFYRYRVSLREARLRVFDKFEAC